MISIIYVVGEDNDTKMELLTQPQYEKFCDKMDKKYGYDGWDILYQERI